MVGLATTTFEWLPGGYFLQQRIRLDFAGLRDRGLGGDRPRPGDRHLSSMVYPSMAGTPIPYRWEIDGDELTITTEVIGATFHGRWSEDGTTFSGGWQPDPGREGPGNLAYDIRAAERRPNDHKKKV